VDFASLNYSRRGLGRLALAVLPGARLLAKPNSKIGGVQIGINVPYSFRNMAASGDEILLKAVQLGLSAVELRSQPVEVSMGAPANLLPNMGGGRRGNPGAGPEGVQAKAGAEPGGLPAGRKGGGRAPLTPEQQAAQRERAEALRKWRLAAPMDRAKAFRKKYEDAGVLIQIVKIDGIDAVSDEEVDYCFDLAKGLGAKAISCEIPLSRTKRLGAFGEKHKMRIGYHGHTDITSPEAFGSPESWEKAMAFSKYNCINLDIGHFVAANNYSPAEYLKKHHDRVTHVHIKDRKKDMGPNTPFGQGDTPIKEILQLMKKEKYDFQATIEFEYRVPDGSELMAEIQKCVDYCRNALG